MAKPFQELVSKMSPEAQERIKNRTAELLVEIQEPGKHEFVSNGDFTDQERCQLCGFRPGIHISYEGDDKIRNFPKDFARAKELVE